MCIHDLSSLAPVLHSSMKDNMLHVFQVQKSEVHIYIFYDLRSGGRKRKEKTPHKSSHSRLKSILGTDSWLPEGVLWEKCSVAGEVRHESFNSL